jgi:hypothetical protein
LFCLSTGVDSTGYGSIADISWYYGVETSMFWFYNWLAKLHSLNLCFNCFWSSTGAADSNGFDQLLH